MRPCSGTPGYQRSEVRSSKYSECPCSVSFTDCVLSNEWDATDATPAVALFEAWLDLIPPFIQDNILDQLILPRVQRAMSDWKPKRSSASGSLHSIVFAWLPLVGLRAEDLLSDAKRRVKSLFRNVDISKGVPAELPLWTTVCLNPYF
jgi:tuftelin-interacting protein 11